ncbi:hypothetical protein FJ425_23275 [Mesorhizobium sp. B2-7-2]|nr:hypothetical protein FJ425_23275 [Mesorhizobium sp. B2-7-2]
MVSGSKARAPISPLEGEMSGRTEGGAVPLAYQGNLYSTFRLPADCCPRQNPNVGIPLPPLACRSSSHTARSAGPPLRPPAISLIFFSTRTR